MKNNSSRLWLYTFLIIALLQIIHAQFTDWTFQYKNQVNANTGELNSDSSDTENLKLDGNENPNGVDKNNNLNGDNENSEPVGDGKNNAPNNDDESDEENGKTNAPNSDDKDDQPNENSQNNEPNNDDQSDEPNENSQNNAPNNNDESDKENGKTNAPNSHNKGDQPNENGQKNAPNDDDISDEPSENENNNEKNSDAESNEQNDDDENYDNDSETNQSNQPTNKEFNAYKYNTEEGISGFKLTAPEIQKFHIWPAGVIPYYIEPESYDKVLRDKIRSYLNAINVQTGLRFTELPTVPDNDKQRFVMFVNRRSQRDCQAFTINDFTNVGMQPVRLGYDCLGNAANIAAAALALAGVPPMHTSPDRDCYVKVNSENIQPEKAVLFQKLKDTDWLFHDLPYDHCSAGHFGLNQYSVNGKDSISLLSEKNSNTCTVGEVKDLSSIDSIKIKLLYGYLKRNYKQNKVQSDCLKLFKRGPNFNAIKLTAEEPRANPKPDRYLGKVNTPMNCDKQDQMLSEHNGTDSNKNVSDSAENGDSLSENGDQGDRNTDQEDQDGDQADEEGDQEDKEHLIQDEYDTAQGENQVNKKNNSSKQKLYQSYNNGENLSYDSDLYESDN